MACITAYAVCHLFVSVRAIRSWSWSTTSCTLQSPGIEVGNSIALRLRSWPFSTLCTWPREELWYGSSRGGNLSILYSWFVEARRFIWGEFYVFRFEIFWGYHLDLTPNQSWEIAQKGLWKLFIWFHEGIRLCFKLPICQGNGSPWRYSLQLQ